MEEEPSGSDKGTAPRPLRDIQVRVSAPGRSALSAQTRTRYRYEEHPGPDSK